MIRLIVQVGPTNLNRTNFRVFEIDCQALEDLIAQSEKDLTVLETVGLEVGLPAPIVVKSEAAMTNSAPIAASPVANGHAPNGAINGAIAAPLTDAEKAARLKETLLQKRAEEQKKPACRKHWWQVWKPKPVSNVINLPD